MNLRDSSKPRELHHHLLTAAKGGGIVLSGRLFTYGSRFVLAIVLARLLAAERYGEYQLGLTTIEFSAGIASLGLHTALVRFIAAYLSRNDHAGVWGALQVCVTLSTAIGILAAIIVYHLAEGIATVVFQSVALAPLLRVAAIFIPFFVTNDALAAASRGFRNMRYSTFAQFIAHPAIKLALIFLLSLIGLTPTLAIAAAGTAEAMTFLLLAYFVWKQLSERRIAYAPRRDTANILWFAFPLYFSSLLVKFSGHLQVLFLGALATTHQVGVYALARQVSMVSRLFQSVIRSPSEPIVAELLSRSSKKTTQFASFYQTVTKWALMLNMPAFLVFVLLPEPVLTAFGASFAGGGAVLCLLAVSDQLHVATGTSGVVLDMSGQTRLKLGITIVRVFVLVVLNLLLIPDWGALGAAIAMAASDVSASLLGLGAVAKLFRVLPVNKSIMPTLGVGAAAAIGGLVMARLAPPDLNLLNAAGDALAMVSLYGLGLWFVGLSPSERLMITRARMWTEGLFTKNTAQRRDAVNPRRL